VHGAFGTVSTVPCILLLCMKMPSREAKQIRAIWGIGHRQPAMHWLMVASPSASFPAARRDAGGESCAEPVVPCTGFLRGLDRQRAAPGDPAPGSRPMQADGP
jgi:hypothetical protein